MKMPLGTEVDLSPGHTALCADPDPRPAKGAQQLPLFRLMSIVATVAHLSLLSSCTDGRPEIFKRKNV